MASGIAGGGVTKNLGMRAGDRQGSFRHILKKRSKDMPGNGAGRGK